jgi:hypothetical protein
MVHNYLYPRPAQRKGLNLKLEPAEDPDLCRSAGGGVLYGKGREYSLTALPVGAFVTSPTRVSLSPLRRWGRVARIVIVAVWLVVAEAAGTCTEDAARNAGAKTTITKAPRPQCPTKRSYGKARSESRPGGRQANSVGR